MGESTYRIQYYMKKYSPYKNCSCISYTDQRSRARRVGTVAYISNGVEHPSAVQYGITESYEDTINHFPDKKSGRGGCERRGALAGFYGTSYSSQLYTGVRSTAVTKEI